MTVEYTYSCDDEEALRAEFGQSYGQMVQQPDDPDRIAAEAEAQRRRGGRPKADPRLRALNPEWKEAHSWLSVGKPEHGYALICNICCCYLRNPLNLFMPGFVSTSGKACGTKYPHGAFWSSGPQLAYLRAHELDPHHIAALALHRKALPQIAPAMQAVADAQTLAEQRLFVVAFTIGKEDMAILKMNALCNMVKIMSSDALVGVSGHYQEDCACREMVMCLGEELRERHLQDLRDTPALALIIDETTDNRTIEQLIMFNRLIKDYRSLLRYTAMIEVSGTTSEELYTAVTEWCVQPSTMRVI